MKRCKTCGTEKPEAEFFAHPHMRDGLMSKCKKCSYAQSRQWALKNPARVAYHQAAYDAKRRGLAAPDPKSYTEVSAVGGCAICGARGRLQRDHNHQTGKFRGLLCGLCNRSIPALESRLSWHVAALNYLWHDLHP